MLIVAVIGAVCITAVVIDGYRKAMRWESTQSQRMMTRVSDVNLPHRLPLAADPTCQWCGNELRTAKRRAAYAIRVRLCCNQCQSWTDA